MKFRQSRKQKLLNYFRTRIENDRNEFFDSLEKKGIGETYLKADYFYPGDTHLRLYLSAYDSNGKILYVEEVSKPFHVFNISRHAAGNIRDTEPQVIEAIDKETKEYINDYMKKFSEELNSHEIKTNVLSVKKI
ncbi:MAG: hypothetical protein V1818_02820 [Candidatus Aenigmatarchaeota archaeon]